MVTTSHAETEEAVCSVVGTGNPVTAVPIVPVRLKAAGTEMLTYAMLDSCSTATFVLEDVAACLDVKGADTKLMVRTVNSTKLHDAKVLNGLTVTDLNGENAITLPKTYTKEDISAIEVDVQSPELTRRWKHLNRIAEFMPSKLRGVKVGLLIGSNCVCPPKFCISIVFVFSWDRCKSQEKLETMLMQNLGNKQRVLWYFPKWPVEDKVKEIILPLALNKMFELEFHERFDEKSRQYSQEDKKFHKIVHQGIRRTDDNHYEIPLPFRSDDVSFPDNREQVLQRACWLKRMFTRTANFTKTALIL